MPLYSYKCSKPKCYGQESALRSIDDRHNGPLCYCGKQMDLLIQPVAGVVKNPAVPKGSK